MAKKNPNISEEESLRRSHSKWSNFKLTLVELLCAVSVVLLVSSLATFGTDVLTLPVLIAVTAVSTLLTVFSFFLISRFRR